MTDRAVQVTKRTPLAAEEINRRSAICALHGWEYRFVFVRRGRSHHITNGGRVVAVCNRAGKWRLEYGRFYDGTFDDVVQRLTGGRDD